MARSSECSIRFKSGAFLEPWHFPPGAERASSLIHSPLRVCVRGLRRWPAKNEWELFPFGFTETVNVFLAKSIVQSKEKKRPPNLLRDPPRSRHGDKRRWEAERAILGGGAAHPEGVNLRENMTASKSPACLAKAVGLCRSCAINPL